MIEKERSKEMLDLDRIEEAHSKWEAQILDPTLAKMPERAAEFITTSSTPVECLYTPLDLPDFQPNETR